MVKNTKKNTQEASQQNDEDEQINTAQIESAASLEQVAENDPEVEVIVNKLEPREIEKVDAVIRAESYSGPLPHPDHLEQYAKVYEQAPKIIFDMAEKQQNHRHYMEKTEMTKVLNLEKLGIVFGFILALFFLVGGFVLIALDREIYGVAAVIIGLVTLFLRNRDKQNKEKKSNNKNEIENENQSENEPDE